MQEDCTFDANFFGKNVTLVASKLFARGQFIFCLWWMCTTFSHNFKNITQKGQNQSCDTIALKRRFVFPLSYEMKILSLKIKVWNRFQTLLKMPSINGFRGMGAEDRGPQGVVPGGRKLPSVGGEEARGPQEDKGHVRQLPVAQIFGNRLTKVI